MPEPLVAIAQTLHGYDQGHRLLAQSGGLGDDELSILDRLSDLSGYLPPDTSFTHYYTGYPCGRFYALGCTYPDLGARRVGTVFTHTLLIPADLAVQLPDLAALFPLHRRPNASSSGDYRRVLRVALSMNSSAARNPQPEGPVPPRPDLVLGDLPAPDLPTAELRALCVLAFGLRDRPLLWQAPLPVAALRTLWRWLWPAVRRDLAFCTFALQVRSVGGRPFDFLALPDAARGSFHEVRGLPTWFTSGRLEHPSAAATLEEPWLRACAADPAAFIDQRLRFTQHKALGVPGMADLPLLYRLEGLLQDAAERLPAARALGDLLDARFSFLLAEHPLRREASDLLLRAQPLAPLAPRPLWELCDFLGRAATQAQIEAEPTFGARVQALLASELAQRLRSAPELCLAALPELSAVLGRRPEWLVTLEGVLSDWIGASPDEEARARAQALCEMAAAAGLERVAASALRPLSREQRRRLLDGEQESASVLEPSFLGRVGEILGDAMLVYRAKARRGAHAEALRELRALAKKDEQHLESLRDALSLSPAPVRLDFALAHEEHAAIAELALEVAEQALDDLGISLSDLAERAEQGDAAQGARVFLRAARRVRSGERREVLVRYPDLARHCLVVALSDSAQMLPETVKDALAVLPKTELVRADVRQALHHARPGLGRKDALRRIVPALLWLLCEEQIDVAEADAWLRRDCVQDFLSRAEVHPNDLFADFNRHEPDARAIRPLSAAAARSFLDPPLASGTLVKLLQRPLERASTFSLDEAILPLCLVLDSRLPLEDRRALCALCQERVRTLGPQRGYRLLERTFPVVYPELAGDGWGSVRRLLPWAVDYDDRQKAWRHYLLDEYRRRGWPLDSLLRAIGEDLELLKKICGRARKLDRQEGQRLIEQLADVARLDDSIPRSIRQRLRQLSDA